MTERTFYKSRLRNKGQITVPSEIRNLLGAAEGDDLVFHTDEQGQVIVSRLPVVSPEQAWFWSERWQRMEYKAQADIESGRVKAFGTVKEALLYLDHGAETDAKD